MFICIAVVHQFPTFTLYGGALRLDPVLDLSNLNDDITDTCTPLNDVLHHGRDVVVGTNSTGWLFNSFHGQMYSQGITFEWGNKARCNSTSYPSYVFTYQITDAVKTRVPIACRVFNLSPSDVDSREITCDCPIVACSNLYIHISKSSLASNAALCFIDYIH